MQACLCTYSASEWGEGRPTEIVDDLENKGGGIQDPTQNNREVKTF